MEPWECYSMTSLLLLLMPMNYVPAVAVHAAYKIHTQERPVTQCCGLCECGVITHGDGHKTQCPCPKECKCRQCPKPNK
jgi:hypothetical protein